MRLAPFSLSVPAEGEARPIDPMIVIALCLLSAIMATGILFAILITVAAPA